ncbi:sugar transferase [Dietzia sp. CH92]|uniref:sugar transferase n=1 Tax=Dietzia sp. CH92 TaxID=3051823 RepID=UPI0028D07EBB|nr:sugar transferase [Dietzia sp. CH92]
MSSYARTWKRVTDITLASVTLAVISPVSGIIAAAIWLEDRGPAIFRQKRVGAAGKEFTILKFRSMEIGTPSRPSDSAAEFAITRTGRLIRRLNLDELPQLVNVLRGEMSIVGPRPALKTQTEVITARQANGALSLKPGLTGLAQINSYDGMSPVEKARFDGEYASRVSFRLDCEIILRTFGYLLKPPPTY